MNAPRTLVLVALGLVLVPPLAAQNAPPETKKAAGLQVGQLFPFHVADFVNGAYVGRGGCPSVMISNSGGRGVLIWTRDGGEAALSLGAALDGGALKSEKLTGFLVAFADETSQLAKAAKGWTKLTAGKKRSAGETAFQTMKLADSTQVLVFFLDRKEIKHRWDFTTAELTAAKVAELNAAAENFAAEGEQSKANAP